MLGKNFLKKRLKQIKIPGGSAVGRELEIEIGYPADKSHGDYATNLAMVLAGKIRENPKKVAEQVIKALEKSKDFCRNFRAEIAGPGFINFWIKDEALIESLAGLRDKDYGSGRKLSGKKILIEYAQPNPFKSFHIGHLRNIIIGEAMARILENAGARVTRVNYQGDIGLHVAKCFWGMRQKEDKRGKLSAIDEKVNYLADCYVAGAQAYKKDKRAALEIQEWNKRLYKMNEPKNKELKKEWKEKRQWCLDKFNEIYSRLGVKFDRSYFESEMFEPGLEHCHEAKNKGILIEDDGCLIFDGEKHGLGKRVFVNKLGLPTYEAKELALAFREFDDFGCLDKAIHVVANEQINFFKITFLVEKLLDEKLFDEKQVHLSHGLVGLKAGKMSSREGSVILAEDIIGAAVNEIMELLSKRKDKRVKRDERDEIAEAVAVAAVKYSFLKISARKDMVFDLGESVRLEGQSGPYVMYSLVRAKNILDKLEIKDNKAVQGGEFKKQERDLACAILKLPEILERAAQYYELASVAEYAYDLAVAFSNFYDKCRVLDEKNKKTRQRRLLMVQAFHNALWKCLDVMGIKPAEKM
ncbi:MAG: arginine--tRNA ligase [Patescibacteria group bacterium]|nr:arginine--tRNA ligase [Patescibacteria group bacterium]